jgi:exosortase D (VPLPA-CTERM-specific)
MTLPWNPLFRNRLFWLGAVLPALLLGLIYSRGIAYMVRMWVVDENYGHGFFVPFISLYLIWQRREEIQKKRDNGSFWGVAVVLISVGLYFIGELATLYLLVHLSLWGMVAGLVLAAIGLGGAKVIAFPLVYLLAMIPLPDFLYQGLSRQLQLISSALGVGCLQFVGVTAFREGNVIDLGPIQLQVVEACSGLRYLFPLAALALICAYLFRDRMWKRAVLFLSSFPIAIFLNGFRIGMTGVLVELYGKGTAEGFFHQFSGWLLFVTSLSLLFLEMALLHRIDRRPEPIVPSKPNPAIAPASPTSGAERPGPRMAPTYLFSLGLLVPVLLASFQIETRQELFPPRASFTDFPMQLDGWEGETLTMEAAYRDALRFDDYLLADYRKGAEPPVNFYVAYYQSQRKGQSAHSPRTCIPGGGWEITSLQPMEIDGPESVGTPLIVNRALIQKGDDKQVVFYWFQQRGRTLTNEYLVKFYLLWDALTRNRTDGALIRLVAPVPPGGDPNATDQSLIAFAKSVRPLLAAYVPE